MSVVTRGATVKEAIPSLESNQYEAALTRKPNPPPNTDANDPRLPEEDQNKDAIIGNAEVMNSSRVLTEKTDKTDL